MQNNIVEYISNRIKEQKYGGKWITLEGQEISADLEYVSEWWEECMLPELKQYLQEEVTHNAE